LRHPRAQFEGKRVVEIRLLLAPRWRQRERGKSPFAPPAQEPLNFPSIKFPLVPSATDSKRSGTSRGFFFIAIWAFVSASHAVRDNARAPANPVALDVMSETGEPVLIDAPRNNTQTTPLHRLNVHRMGAVNKVPPINSR
jgi:hypothetical protein